MFYKLLSIELDQRLKDSGQRCKVTVVNLAMAASHIYQNFIALNKWAHALHPDAIISFSGHNEIAVPWMTKSDADQLSFFDGGLIHVLRYSASPHWLKWIAQYYPGIVRRTMLGSLIRLFYVSDYRDGWLANYYLSRTDPTFGALSQEELQRRYQVATASLTLGDVIDRVSIPLYEHSLESISRDFPDTTLFAVFQPLHNSWLDVYAHMRTVIPEKVRDKDHYDNVQFFDLQRVWEQNEFFPGSLVDSVHLSNKGHIRVAKYLSDDLFPFVHDRCDQLAAAKSPPAR